MKYYRPEQGSFADPPSRPNWVSSQTASAANRMDPLPFHGTADRALAGLLDVVRQLPRTSVVEQTGDSLHVECRSRLFGFVDDVEFVVDPENAVIHFCSAARSGWSDLGVNHRRMLHIRELFGDMN